MKMHADTLKTGQQGGIFVLHQQGEGFFVKLDGTSELGSEKERSLPFQWKQLVERPTDIMFFALPRDSIRPFGELFRKMTGEQDAHDLVRHMVLEYRGDVIQSSTLRSVQSQTESTTCRPD